MSGERVAPARGAPAARRASGIAAWIVERVALVGLSLLVLAGVEVALRLAGQGGDTSAVIDFGTAGHQRIYGPDPDDPGVVTLAPWIRAMRPVNVRKLVNRSRFPARRDPGELRIFAVGESTVFGYPADGRIAFPARLQEILAARLPGRAVRVVNAGIPTYDSYRVEEVLAAAIADAIDWSRVPR